MYIACKITCIIKIITFVLEAVLDCTQFLRFKSRVPRWDLILLRAAFLDTFLVLHKLQTVTRYIKVLKQSNIRMGIQKKKREPRIDKKHTKSPICGRTLPHLGKVSKQAVNIAIIKGVPHPKSEQNANFILSLPFLKRYGSLYVENSKEKTVFQSSYTYTSWNCPNLNFCAKSCQSRYLF